MTDLLNIDFQRIIPEVIKAYTKVFGEEYYDIIRKRLSNTIIVNYQIPEQLSWYLSEVKTYKARELSLKFLELIGELNFKAKNYNYTRDLPESVQELLGVYLLHPFGAFKADIEKFPFIIPLNAFQEYPEADPNEIIENKLKIINHLRNQTSNPVTLDNFEDFTKTTEYRDLLSKINKYLSIYNELRSEYADWSSQFQKYEIWISTEKNRLKVLLTEQEQFLYDEIFSKLPEPVKQILLYKTNEERREIIFGTKFYDLSSPATIEFFNKENFAKLESSESSSVDRWIILENHKQYFTQLGLSIPKFKHDIPEEISDYLAFLNQDSIKSYIPYDIPDGFANYRETKYQETIEKYYLSNEVYQRTAHFFANSNELTKKHITKIIKENSVCIIGGGATDQDGNFKNIMFYTVRTSEAGYQSHAFLHECGHVIEQGSVDGFGFEVYPNRNSTNHRNSYDEKFRKYEKFNETINDIFALEAKQILEQDNIYLFEPSKFTANTINYNTSSYTKSILHPLLRLCRSQVIRTKIFANHQYLTDYIGQDNFEDLVDVVNKVDYLSRNGLENKLKESSNDPMVLEYNEQLTKTKTIYSNIFNYFENKSNSMSEDFLFNPKNRN